MKILNLYAGEGFNRKLWPIREGDLVVAVEIEPEYVKIAEDRLKQQVLSDTIEVTQKDEAKP